MNKFSSAHLARGEKLVSLLRHRRLASLTDLVRTCGLGSGLIEFQSQKMTVAARAMAERKTLGQRS